MPSLVYQQKLVTLSDAAPSWNTSIRRHLAGVSMQASAVVECVNQLNQMERSDGFGASQIARHAR